MYPTLLKIGSFELASYGVMTALAYGVSSWYLGRRLSYIKLDKDTFWNIIFIAFVSALAGAKILYLILTWKELGNTFAERVVYAVQNIRYGFVFFGGAIAAICTLVYYLKKKKLPVFKTADFFIVALPLGHAIGRIGCFLAGCCYGKPTTLPWGVTFTHPHTLVPPPYAGISLHPTQLYETALNLILFFILHRYYQKPHKDGAVLALYLVGYGLIRFGTEFLRADFRGGFFLGLSPSQLISLLAALAAFIVWRYLQKGVSHAR